METINGKVCEFGVKIGKASEVIAAIQNHRNAVCGQYGIREYYTGDFIHDFEYIQNHGDCNKFILICTELQTHIIVFKGNYFEYITSIYDLTESKQITGYFLLTRISDTELRASELFKKDMQIWIETIK